MAAKKTDSLSFDAALGELEQIVDKLEQGDLPLEDALKQFERGIHRITSYNVCYTKLLRAITTA